MVGARNPQRPAVFQHPAARPNPVAVKFIILLRPVAFVPFALVHAGAFSRVAGKAVVGKVVWRVGENQINASFGKRIEDFDCIAVEQSDPAVFIKMSVQDTPELAAGQNIKAALHAPD